nr:gamma-glutamyltransferase [uncultured Sphingomonas sp.]
MRFFPILLSVASLGLSACTTTPHLHAAPPQRAHGLVSAADPRAAEAGASILRQGGSATDAAVATMLALTVVEPQSSGIGGGSFLVTYDPATGVESYNGRETAPASAAGDWFFKDGKPMPIDEAIPGGRSVGIPGNIRNAAVAHRDHGKLPWSVLFQPAISLARDGFLVTPRLYTMLDRYRATGAMTAEGRAIYYQADGSPKPVGTRIVNPALAATLETLAARGPDSFYVGPNAQAIVAAANGAEKNPSKMDRGDLATYDAQKLPPVCGEYRGYRICGMGPPSSGATTVFAILKQLERFDLGALGKDDPRSWHLIAESMRLGYADRERYLADADYIRVPVKGLMDPTYLARRSQLIHIDGTMAAVSAGLPAGAPPVGQPLESVEHGTTHFVAVDQWGNVASETSTIESAFGSGLMVGGYYLNNELTDFSLAPTDSNGLVVANRVEGGKRPRSSMAPTIVFSPDGRVRLAVGAAGGATIIAQVAKAIIGVIDWNLSAQDAIALPVLFSPGSTVWVEKGTSQEAMIPALIALGHRDVRPREPGFKANAIEWIGTGWAGAADPRSEGAAEAP